MLRVVVHVARRDAQPLPQWFAVLVFLLELRELALLRLARARCRRKLAPLHLHGQASRSLLLTKAPTTQATPSLVALGLVVVGAVSAVAAAGIGGRAVVMALLLLSAIVVAIAQQTLP